MTDSLERFLQDLRFDVPVGLVDRAKAAAAPRQRSGRDRPMGRRMELVVGIAAALLALIVIGTFAYIRMVASPRLVVPVLPDPTTKQYQVRIAADQAAAFNFLEDQCNINGPLSTACADRAPVAIGLLQQWLDDLDQTRPPARFAAIDGRLRDHLAMGIAYLHAVIAANTAMDESGATAAVAAAQNERDTVNREASDIVFSSQETTGSYSAIVHSDSSKLLACDLCQKLVNQASCQASQASSCSDEIAATRLQVETFQDDTVRGFAPNPLAAKDQRLQTDLLAADAALDAMGAAQSAGDRMQVAAGQNALRQVLSLVNSDATDIAKGA